VVRLSAAEPIGLGEDPAEEVLRLSSGFVSLFGLGLVGGGLGLGSLFGLGLVGGGLDFGLGGGLGFVFVSGFVLVGGGLGLAAGGSVVAVGARGTEVVLGTRTAGDDALVTPCGG
jgi:hypothetical protein